MPGREVRSEDLASLARAAPLTRGLGRAYGDSALPPAGAEWVAGSTLANRLLSFDRTTGTLRAEAGLALGDLVWTTLPEGWFPPVVPGTQFVTLGGMVAADIHGKNHHVDGTIGRHVDRLLLITGNGDRVECSRSEHADLFRATLGGMGLTGHILEVELRLGPIPSPWIVEERFRVDGIDALLVGLAESARDWPFTVAWIDCLARGRHLGRGAVIRGRWAEANEARAGMPRPLSGPSVPFVLPNWALNDWTARLFNGVYSASYPRRPQRRISHPASFFWPLDGVRHWNRIYGRRGFTQFQCVLPERERPGAVRRFLEAASRRGGASFLCVLKDCGAEGEGLLSFPRPGVSVALDLPMRGDTRELVQALGDLVAGEGGRIYLAKDAFLRADQFARMEPRLAEFQSIRRSWDPAGHIRSAQSERLLGDRP